MRYGVLADIHSNDDALKAVLNALRKEKIDKYVCVGDIVGYGAEPAQCVTTIKRLCCACVAGNHDFATIEKTNVELFNAYAKQATYWTRERLKPQHKQYLEGLKLVEDVDKLFTLVHGTLYSPALFEYIQTTFDAYLSFQVLERPLCFVGHSHVPISFFLDDGVTYSVDPVVELKPGMKAIVNVGSIGQPRDENPDAAYAIYDSEKNVVWIKRIPYDIDKAVRKIKEAGLPEILGERLRVGR